MSSYRFLNVEALECAPGEGPSRGLLNDCEILANLRLKITVISPTLAARSPASCSRGAAWLARVAAAVARVSMVPLSRGPGDCAQLPAPAAADTGVIDPDTGTGTHRPAPPGEISTIC